MSSDRPPSSRLGASESASIIVTRAICLECGAEIGDWRERLLPIEGASLALTERGELALHVDRDGACGECGGGSAEIRVEARRPIYV